MIVATEVSSNVSDQRHLVQLLGRRGSDPRGSASDAARRATTPGVPRGNAVRESQ